MTFIAAFCPNCQHDMETTVSFDFGVRQEITQCPECGYRDQEKAQPKPQRPFQVLLAGRICVLWRSWLPQTTRVDYLICLVYLAGSPCCLPDVLVRACHHAR